MSGPAIPSVDPEPEAPLSMRWSLGRTLGVMAALSMVLFWLWILSGAPAKPNPDFIQDRALAQQIQDRCKAFRSDLADLPNALETPDPETRAEVLDQATTLASSMIDDIDRYAPDSGDGSESIAGWVKDWRTYLNNRRAFTRELRTDPGARLLLDISPLGDSVDKTIEIFTQVNRIPECATPGDIG
jgi:hypothetical protein